jgi:hypothetical protein
MGARVPFLDLAWRKASGVPEARTVHLYMTTLAEQASLRASNGCAAFCIAASGHSSRLSV